MYCSGCNRNLGNDVGGACPHCGVITPTKSGADTSGYPQHQPHQHGAPVDPHQHSTQAYDQHHHTMHHTHVGHPPYTGYYPQPGKGKAVASLVLGICAIVFSWIPFIGLALGVMGLVMASLARRDGFVGGIRTGGIVCSIIGTVFGSIYTIIVMAACGTSMWLFL